MQVGDLVSHYRIQARVGAGGMGVVYKAEDLKTGRPVAIKILSPDGDVNDLSQSDLLREARAIGRLDHPNICTLFDVGEMEDGGAFIVMAFYEGSTADKLPRGTTLGLGRAVEIARQVAKGLDAAHKKGIIHGDIKPQNLMITEEGVLKILDFGVARSHGRTVSTRNDLVAGTLAYMAPEQLNGELVDFRADLWSLGVVLHELLTGSHPFEGKTPASQLNAILTRPARRLLSIRADAGPRLDLVLSRALMKDPSKRFQTAEEFLGDLEEVGTAARATNHYQAVQEPSQASQNDVARRLTEKGRESFAKYTRWSIERAAKLFSESLAADPGSALPFAGLADCYIAEGVLGERSPLDAFRDAVQTIETTVALAPAAEVHCSMGMIRFWFQWDWPSAERAFRDCLALDPTLAVADGGLAVLLALTQRPDEAAEHAARATKLDPYSSFVSQHTALCYIILRQYGAAMACSDRAIRHDPETVMCRWLKAVALVSEGRFVDACAFMDESVETCGPIPLLVGGRGACYALLQRREAAIALDDLRHLAQTRYVSPILFADIYAGLGQTDLALHWLNLAVEQRNPFVAVLSETPFYQELRKNAQFLSIVASLGNT